MMKTLDNFLKESTGKVLYFTLPYDDIVRGIVKDFDEEAIRIAKIADEKILVRRHIRSVGIERDENILRRFGYN